MKSLRSIFTFLFLHLPRIAFRAAGLIRAVNRGKKAFRKSLKREGLPEEVVEELVREFDPLEGFGLREVLSFSRGGRRGRG